MAGCNEMIAVVKAVLVEADRTVVFEHPGKAAEGAVGSNWEAWADAHYEAGAGR